MARPFANAIESSQNSKLTTDHRARPVSVTMASQHTCPSTCSFRGNGCYAESGPMGIQTHRLNRDGILSADAFAQYEAYAIDGLTGRNMLRIHEVGDCTTDSSARIIAAAAERYIAKHGQKVFGYTHAWRTIDRASWGPISIIASCESPAECLEATARGYATALVVADHANMPATIGNMKTFACPQQIGTKADCYSCKICTMDSKLRGRAVVTFAVHSATGKRRIPAILAAKTRD